MDDYAIILTTTVLLPSTITTKLRIKAKYHTLSLDCQSLDKIISGLPKLLSGYGLIITAYNEISL